MSKLEKPITAEKDRKVQQRSARVRRMAKSLGAMAPASAAVALSRMSDGLAVEILLVLDAKKLGKILESMQPERAAVLMQAVVGLEIPVQKGN